MGVSFDGMRQNATEAYNKLIRKIETNTDQDGIIKLDRSEIMNAMDELRMVIVVLNCTSDSKYEDWGDMSKTEVLYLSE
jgi:hypothetical protein